MSLAGDGEMTVEPTVGEARRAQLKAQLRKRADERRGERVVAGGLWVGFGALLVIGVLLVSWGLALDWPFLVASGVFSAATWAGVTAALIVRQS